AALGQPSAALRQYQELERLLRDEWNETPSAETRALAEELRRNARTLVVARRARAVRLHAPGSAIVGERGSDIGPADRSPKQPSEQVNQVQRELAADEGAPVLRQSIPNLAGTLTLPPGSDARTAGSSEPRSRVPASLTRFFGREEESARLSEWLASGVTRLVTLTGPGGSGKTRLALAVAERMREPLGDAVAVVPLADLTEGAR